LAKVAHYNRGSSTVDVEETMALQPSRQNWISPEEYLAGELISDIKHEYIDGEVYAMTGTSINHGRIISVMMRLLGNHLANTPCDVFAADIKVKAQNNFFYPDLIVDCQKLNGEVYVSEAPLIIVEVLSKSTRKQDQTLKRLAYQGLPSLHEYVLIEQDFVDIEICRRSNHWQSEHFYLGDQVYFSAIELSLPVEQIYARVDNEDMQAFTLAQSQQNPSL
jgi:Uma2 family endonuclease